MSYPNRILQKPRALLSVFCLSNCTKKKGIAGWYPPFVTVCSGQVTQKSPAPLFNSSLVWYNESVKGEKRREKQEDHSASDVKEGL